MPARVPAAVDGRAGRRRPARRVARRAPRRGPRRHGRAARRGAQQPDVRRAGRPTSSGCCAARRPVRCCRPRTTSCASTASSTCWLAPTQPVRVPRPVAVCEDAGRARRAVLPDGAASTASSCATRCPAGSTSRPARPRPRPGDGVRRGAPGRRRAVRRPPGSAGRTATWPGSCAAGPGSARASRPPSPPPAGGPATCPTTTRVRDWLAAHLPDEAEPAVVHGDAKLDNVVVGAGGDAGASPRSLDWEMATVGDPRADLGYLLSFWPEPAGRGRPPAGPAGHRRRRLPDPRRAGRRLGAGDRPDRGRPHLVRHPGGLEARRAARGVLPPAPRRQHRRPVLRHPRAGCAGPARPRPGDLRCLSCEALVVDWGGVLTEPLDAAIRAWAEVDGVDFEHYVARDARVARHAAGRAGPRQPGGGAGTRRDRGAALRGAARRPAQRGDRHADRARPACCSGCSTSSSTSRPWRRWCCAPSGPGCAPGCCRTRGATTYPREGWDQMFDAVVISGEVGMRKPEPRDLRAHARPARRTGRGDACSSTTCGRTSSAADALGLVGVHHTSYDETATSWRDSSAFRCGG